MDEYMEEKTRDDFIERQKADKAGLSTFTSSTPCSEGHFIRYVKCGACKKCKNRNAQLRRRKDKINGIFRDNKDFNNEEKKIISMVCDFNKRTRNYARTHININL